MDKPDNGKGDCPRPMQVPLKDYLKKWDIIFRKETNDKSKRCV